MQGCQQTPRTQQTFITTLETSGSDRTWPTPIQKASEEKPPNKILLQEIATLNKSLNFPNRWNDRSSSRAKLWKAFHQYHCCRASLVAQSVKKKKKKKSTCNAGDHLQCRKHGFEIWVGKIPYRRERLPTPAFLPGEFHGQRSLVGYSPWGRKEWDMT